MHSSQAIIRLSHLKFNLLQVRKKIGTVKLMAVVKADAYGHGAVEVVKYYNSLGKYKPDYYAVACTKEAVELREAGIKDPILVFDPFEKINAEACIKYNLIATVFNKKHIEILKGFPKKIKVHIKTDTGMNRVGIDYHDAYDFVKYVYNRKEFILDGFYTHFAEADSRDKTFTLLQLKRFNEIVAKLKSENIKLGLVHAANSSAMLDLADSYFDMVRCGITLYGYYPSLETSESVKLKPV
ncbi:MAG: alanine racemase, partial [Ignavibacteriales bacterium]